MYMILFKKENSEVWHIYTGDGQGGLVFETYEEADETVTALGERFKRQHWLIVKVPYERVDFRESPY
jgi:hypothetical protein